MMPVNAEENEYDMPKIEMIGVYPVKAPEPVHLVELWVRGATGVFSMGGFTQEIPGELPRNWQVPFMEQILSASGGEVLAGESEAPRRLELWKGDMRLAFFFHFLDFQRPLRTPFGEVLLSAPSALPARLSMIQYDEP